MRVIWLTIDGRGIQDRAGGTVEMEGAGLVGRLGFGVE